MYSYSDGLMAQPPKGYRWEAGRCPNAGHACFCIGACQPRLVKIEGDEDAEADEGDVRY